MKHKFKVGDIVVNKDDRYWKYEILELKPNDYFLKSLPTGRTFDCPRHVVEDGAERITKLEQVLR